MPDDSEEGTDLPPGPACEQPRSGEKYTCLFCDEQSPMEEAQQQTEGGSFYLRCTACGQTA